MGGAATLLLFICLLAHELGHAVQARRDKVRVDGITLWLVLLTTFLTPLIFLSQWNSLHKHPKEYIIAFLVIKGKGLPARAFGIPRRPCPV